MPRPSSTCSSVQYISMTYRISMYITMQRGDTILHAVRTTAARARRPPQADWNPGQVRSAYEFDIVYVIW